MRVPVPVERPSKAAALTLVLFCWALGMGCDFARHAGYRMGFGTFSPHSAIEISFVVQDSKGNPIGDVAVVNEIGEQLGTSAPGTGLVTITERFSRSSWYFRPKLVLPSPGGTQAQAPVAGRLIVLTERERVLGKRPIVVQLDSLASASQGASGEVLRSADEEDDFGDEWESFRDSAPRLPGLPLVGTGNMSFVEEDLDDGAQESDSPRAAAAEAVTGVLAALDAPLFVTPASPGRSRNFVTDNESPHSESESTPRDNDANQTMQAAAASQSLAPHQEARLGALRQFEEGANNRFAGAERQNEAETTTKQAVSDTAGPSRVQAEAQAETTARRFLAAPEGQVARFPKAFARMESWGLPVDKIRRLSFATPDTSSLIPGELGKSEGGEVVRVFGISTQKESEIELGVIPVAPSKGENPAKLENLGTASLRLDVLVPEAARFDLVRAELPGCGGIVTPLLASSPGSPQELSCAKLTPSINKGPGWTQTIGVMYLAHGVMRYFRGGKIDAGAQTADVSGNLSLFRLSVPLASEGAPSLPVVHLRHPDVAGGEAVIEPSKTDSTSLPYGRPSAHRFVALKNAQNPKPRVSLVVRRSEGGRHVDGALVGRFQRAFFAHFVNSKFFVPVPWQTLEQQLGTPLPFEKTIVEGWRGSVLDILVDYTIVLQPRDRSLSSDWYDREGKIVGHKEHPYRSDIPPELLAREVYDGLLDNLPVGGAAQTATR